MIPDNPASNIDIVQLVIGVAGGLAIFLIGLNQLTDSLQAVAGDRMRTYLERMTANRVTGLFSGVVVTTLTQSSSVTTVLLVGFVSASLMTFPQTIGIILGSGVASTFTAQIIAFKVTQYALGFVALGFVMSMMSGRRRSKQLGLVILALGLIFFGMAVMGDATRPLRDWQPFMNLIIHMRNLWLAMLIGTLFTAVIQSSGASIGLLIVLAGNGIIPLDEGIALMFGANIGTCITALLAAIGKPRAAQQVAFAHVTIKIVGVLIWMPFISDMVRFTEWLSPSYPGLEGAARLAREAPRQIANAHTLFNIVNAFLFIWFVTPLTWLIGKLHPDRPVVEDPIIQAKYLDPGLLSTPVLALDRVRLEIKRLGGYTARDIDRVMTAAIGGYRDDLDEIKHDQTVMKLHMQILEYIRALSRAELTERQSEQMEQLLFISDYYAAMNEISHINMTTTGRERIKYGIACSDETRRRLNTLFDRTREAVRLVNKALETQDRALALRVIGMKKEIEGLGREAMDYLSTRLLADLPKRAETFRIESDCIAQAKRLYYYAKRIARIIDTGIVSPEDDGDEEG